MSRDTSFYYAFLMLPPARRNAIVAVWDFCRAVDDAVDEAMPEGEGALTPEARRKASAELALWRSELAAAFGERNTACTTPQGRALTPFVREFGLPRQPLEDLVDGVEMDLNRARYQTHEELVEYCRRVASAVGLVCIRIFGCRDEGATEYAVQLGLALQMTNIIRDVGADLKRGRVYIPQDDLARFGCTDADLARGELTEPVRAVLRFECERAREYFARASRALPPADTRRLVAAEIMGAIYFDILRRIEKSGYDVFSTKHRVPRPARAWIALRTWARTLGRALGAEPVHA